MRKLLFVFSIIAFFACSQKEVSQQTFEFPFQNPSLSVDERVADLIGRMTLEEKCSQMLYTSPAIERFGIPEYNWWNEALHGVARSGRATVFPQCIGLAATFDTNLIERLSSAISDEARAKYNIAQSIGNRGQYAGLSFWSPNVNIFRDPRWGRGQETWGEDPFLTGRMGLSFVKGMQGNDPKYLKTAACAKHYVVHSGPEGERHTFNALPPKKDFFETYLPAFKTLVQEGNVEAVMCAYNRTYNWPCCGNKYLLQDILRTEWSFKGHIVSDCWALVDFHENHKVTKTSEESAALALNSGVNLNCGIVYKDLAKAIKMGLADEKTVDKELALLLRTRFKLGLFDPKGMNPYDKIDESVINSPKHRSIAREAAAKSVVMLKNKNNVLPLKKDIRKMYVIGPNAASTEVLLGNYYGVSGDMRTILEGITAKVSAGSTVEYKMGVTLAHDNINPIDWVTGEAHGADAIVMVAGISGMIEGEEGESILSDNKGDRKDITLPKNQIEFIKKLRSQGDKPIILVLTGGSPIALGEIADSVDAILFVWYPGEEGGEGVADVMFGDVNPSGRLPLTFPKSIQQLPDYNDYSMKGRTYRYMTEEPEFPFGFGLSYTQFEYSEIKLSKSEINDSESITVTATLTNKGTVEGEEVAQLYLSQKVDGLEMPLYSLRGFRRLKLKAGESQQVSFSITPKMMSIFTNEGDEMIVKGDVLVTIAGASPSSRAVDLGAAKPVSSFIKIK